MATRISGEDLLKANALLSREIDQYQQSLGRFVAAFSQVEANLQTVLWHFAGVKAPTAQAVFSGVRVEGAMGFINRIAEAQRWRKSKRDKLQYIFTQLGIINKLRNDILHYGAQLHARDTWVVSNRLFAHIPKRVRQLTVSPSILDDASFDLRKIESHLIVMAWHKVMPPGARAAFRPALKAAWRYKQPQPSRPARKSRKIPQGRRPRPRASAGSP
jgi:hypothetical protein